MGESLQDSLNQIFDLEPQEETEAEQTPDEKPEDSEKPQDNKPPVTEELGQSELIKKANQQFKQAEQAQKDGNWSEYGKYLDELKETLEKLESK